LGSEIFNNEVAAMRLKNKCGDASFYKEIAALLLKVS
jgi:hypothetical protein